MGTIVECHMGTAIGDDHAPNDTWSVRCTQGSEASHCSTGKIGIHESRTSKSIPFLCHGQHY